MEIISSEVQQLRQQLGLTQDEMGNKLGVSGKYVGMIERGEKSITAASSIGILFNLLREKGCLPGESAAPLVSSYLPKHTIRMIPVVGWAHAGLPERYEEMPAGWQNLIPTECRDSNAFGVILEGDSMEPGFKSGDNLVLMPSEEPHSGCYAVCRFADDGIVFRRLEFMGESVRLVPLNERYEATTHTRGDFAWIYPLWGRWSQLWR